MFNYLPLYQSSPTQSTTNRKTKTDFGEDFHSADALHRCAGLAECLGIIVTHFACMMQRLASSMRPTIYASAASCKHMIVPLEVQIILAHFKGYLAD